MDNGIKSVDRAFQLLEQISLYKDGAAITELAGQSGMYKSTVHRVLQTLVRLRYVEQDVSTARYRLGTKVIELSSRVLSHMDLRKEAYPLMEQLVEETGEVCHLVVLEQEEAVYIEKVEGRETIRMHSHVGKRAPIHCTAVGKCILAFLPEEDARYRLSQTTMVEHTEKTITDLGVMMQHLQEVRTCGYAIDDEENEQGISCVAAPIFDQNGHIIAAVSLSAPTMRMAPERIEWLAERMKRVGADISARMGWSR